MLVGNGIIVKKYTFISNEKVEITLPNNKVFLIIDRRTLESEVSEGIVEYIGLQLSSKMLQVKYRGNYKIYDIGNQKDIILKMADLYLTRVNLDEYGSDNFENIEITERLWTFILGVLSGKSIDDFDLIEHVEDVLQLVSNTNRTYDISSEQL